MDEKLEELKRLVDVFGSEGNYNFTEFDHGRWYGLEQALALFEDRKQEDKPPFEYTGRELYKRMKALQEVKEYQTNGIINPWNEYVEFMKSKYGEDFEWTCSYLKKIDDTIKSWENRMKENK